MLRKKRAFLRGSDVNVMPVPTEKFDKKRKPIYDSFLSVGDVLPIETRDKMASAEEYSRLFTFEQ